MRSLRPTISLGDLIALAYDTARELTPDRQRAARITTVAVTEVLRTPSNRPAAQLLAHAG